ncbi:MAG: NADH-quinone oxidoreductase subunit F [Actinomycetota bacterium]|nr:NADH-quinone oxidoreductase subunit F [Actinomycetota bacterium]
MTAVQTSPLEPGVVGRLFAAERPTLDAHLSAYGALPTTGNLLELVDRAGVLGRGGAGFPSAKKISGLTARGGGVVVANGAEGEPASDKDAVLLTHAPHLVLDGLSLVVAAAWAKTAYVVVSRPTLLEPLRRALAERRERVPVKLRLVEDRFISGEESALVNALNGRPALPSDRLIRVYERGVGARPTLVHNIETLAQIALVSRFGAEWFRSVGSHDEPGTFLATLSGAVGRPGVFEVAYGGRLADLLNTAQAGTPQAVLIGGYHGAWVPGDEVDSVRLSRKGLAPFDASIGAGVVFVLGQDRCPLEQSAQIAGYLADESAGQCGPCINGLPRMADTLARIARREHDPRLPGEVERLRRLVTGRGACTHPDGTARFVSSTMRVFADEVARHQRGGCRVSASR